MGFELLDVMGRSVRVVSMEAISKSDGKLWRSLSSAEAMGDMAGCSSVLLRNSLTGSLFIEVFSLDKSFSGEDVRELLLELRGELDVLAAGK